MSDIITGYQWGDTGALVGPYQFPDNADKKAIHLPPRTTLQVPPANVPVDQEVYWTGATWALRNLSMDWLVGPPQD